MYIDKEDGTVQHDDDACIGCQSCVRNCPYDVPQFIAERKITRKCDACIALRAAGEEPACVACRKGVGTETFLTSTQCPRSCYFCFNPNQDNYEYGLTHVNDIAGELRQRVDAGVRYSQLAVTGGEPLLHPDTVLGFLEVCESVWLRSRFRACLLGICRESGVLGKRCVRFSGISHRQYSRGAGGVPADRDLPLHQHRRIPRGCACNS